MEACCKTENAPHAHDEFLDDPTLADCCRRDLEEQAHTERLVNRLKECDISAAHQRVEAAVIGRHPEDIPENGAEVDSLVTDSDDEGLQHARESRLHELQKQARLRAAEWDQGQGALQDIPANTLQDILDDAVVPMIVCHLAAEGSSAGDELDELLQSLAGQYRGTYFCRVDMRAGTRGLSTPAVKHIPGLCMFKDGAVTCQVPLSELIEEDEIIEERVISYLKRAGALRQSRGEQQDASADAANSENEADASEWRAPCEICGRRYYHEHVRSVTRGNQYSGDEPD